MKLWSGRFSKELAESALRFSESTEVDSEMIEEDIWGSEAHTLMLSANGIISDEEAKVILEHLERARRDSLDQTFQLKPELEDVHMNVESYIIEGAGVEYGGKLHTARSRNDQVLTDAKLYTRERILEVQSLLCELQTSLLEIAEREKYTMMPGYTHVQHAQPITVGFWATGYVSMFLRDQRRLRNAYEIVNSNPLGACALAGTSFPIDRELTQKLLSFDSMHEHSLDAVSSRDFVAETLFALTMLGANLSKMAEEIVYWSSFEFSLITLDDAFASGSSIMPQKKNPEIAELVRSRTGRLYGALMHLLTSLKGLPMGYNRDLQEDKVALWRAFKDIAAALNVLKEMLRTLHFNKERMAELASANFATATELANFLVRERGLAFRESHRIVGEVVRKLIEEKSTFENVERTQALLKEQGVALSAEEISKATDLLSALEAFTSQGSSSPAEVERMRHNLASQLEEERTHIEQKRSKIAHAKDMTARIVEGALGESKRSIRQLLAAEGLL